tara:strand:- start:353 stop:667 length:315 start_codon:yes stop_codon:yes gene_type:complete
MLVIEKNNIVGTYSKAQVDALEEKIDKYLKNGGSIGVAIEDWQIKTKLSEISNGEFFALTPKCSTVYTKEKFVYVKGRITCMNNKTGEYRNLKGDTIVYIGFTY